MKPIRFPVLTLATALIALFSTALLPAQNYAKAYGPRIALILSETAPEGTMVNFRAKAGTATPWIDLNGNGICEAGEAKLSDEPIALSPWCKKFNIFGQIEELEAQDIPELTEIDLSSGHYIKVLRCNGGRLTGLDFSKSPLLEELYCADNQLSSLKVTACPELRVLYCPNNLPLKALDLSRCPKLSSFTYTGSPITKLIRHQEAPAKKRSCWFKKRK